MSGIVFFSTNDLEGMKRFYIDDVGCELWLDQGDCLIFRHGNLLVGFMQRSRIDREGIITFFFEEKEAVDGIFARLAQRAEEPPRRNEKYGIYHFFTEDPEGRILEFQHFENELPPCKGS